MSAKNPYIFDLIKCKFWSSTDEP